ncbi:flagellar motor switch protein FliM [Pseudorhodobacter sp.]|uniref:flagellar motor switch protein FliM n=1 Tax=Pseudorhodobacter sp. TaxID=1934400 RepID=UPI002AFE62BE|nr:FliM/FliN family flagellar motor switch protein [Pseudorhodobacter sp.]
MEQSGIKRKISLSRKSVPIEVQGVAKAWKLALARAAYDAIGIELGLVELSQNRSSLAELLDLPPDRALVAMLEGPKDGLGLLMIAPDILAGILEMQMVGRIGKTPPLVRRPTRTDAAMVSGIINSALRGLEVELFQSDDLIWAGGFRYASFLEDARPLPLLLEDVTYQVLKIDISLAEGARTGHILLALPADGRGEVPKAASPPPSRAAELVFKAAMNAQVLEANAELIAVLARISLPLEALLNLKVGDHMALGAAALDQIDLVGLDGKRLASGKLGQNSGLRAVRLAAASSPAAHVDAAIRPAQMPEKATDIQKAG